MSHIDHIRTYKEEQTKMLTEKEKFLGSISSTKHMPCLNINEHQGLVYPDIYLFLLSLEATGEDGIVITGQAPYRRRCLFKLCRDRKFYPHFTLDEEGVVDGNAYIVRSVELPFFGLVTLEEQERLSAVSKREMRRKEAKERKMLMVEQANKRGEWL